MKKRHLIWLWAALLFWSGPAWAEEPKYDRLDMAASAALSRSTDAVLKQIWPDLPPVYRFMATLSASMLVGVGKDFAEGEFGRDDLKKDLAGALVGVSFTIEW